MPPCSLNIHARLVTVTGGSEEEDIRERESEREMWSGVRGREEAGEGGWESNASSHAI